MKVLQYGVVAVPSAQFQHRHTSIRQQMAEHYLKDRNGTNVHMPVIFSTFLRLSSVMDITLI